MTLLFFSYVFYSSILSVMFCLFSYLVQTLVYFLCVRFFNCPGAFSTDFEEFSLVIFGRSCFVCVVCCCLSSLFFFFWQYLLLYLLLLNGQFCLPLSIFALFIPLFPWVFLFLKLLSLFVFSCFISYPCLIFLFEFHWVGDNNFIIQLFSSCIN